MHLKFLTMKGFKSFASKTELKFQPGVTVIVGPNGSGKSNIVDAISWVLGEQSPKSLRGSSMEDLFFSGSDSQQRVNFAEVSLSLDNTDGILPLDFTEVTIARRLFRSGESEYLLNGASSRLSDIQELLFDLGLGKSNYSIIRQGYLEEIINSRAEERRSIMEEVSGILKYQKRKDKSLEKLVSIDDKITRGKDILKEIRRQLKPLENQAARSKKHQRLIQKLKEVELGTAITKWQDLGAQEQSLTKEESLLLAQTKNHKEKLKDTEKTIDNLHNELEKKAIFNAKQEDQKRRLISLREKLKGGLVLLEEKERNLVSRSEERKAKVSKAYTKEKQKKVELDNLLEEEKEVHIQLTRLYSKLKEEQKKSEKLKKSQINPQANSLQVLDTKEEKDTAYFILKNQKEGFWGLLEDFIEIPKKYRTAIRKVLNSEFSCILVESYAQVEKAISLLKKEKMGEISFFPLDIIPQNFPSPKPDLPSNLPVLPAIKVIKVKPKAPKALFKALNALLKDVFIVQNLKEGSKLRQENPNLAFVTLEGEVFSKSGRIIVSYGDERKIGSSKQRIIFEAIEREKLRQKEKKVARNLADLQVEIASLRENGIYLKKQISSLRSEINETSKVIEGEKRISKSLEAQKERIQPFREAYYKLLEKTAFWEEKLKGQEKPEPSPTGGSEPQEIKERIDVLKEEGLSLTNIIKSLEQKAESFRIEKAKIGVRIKEIVNQIETKSRLPFKEAVFNYQKTASFNKISEETLENLRLKLSSLGPINLLAEKEYSSLNERYHFLANQIKDLSESKKNLNKVVKAIGQKMEKKFITTITEINKQFQNIFFKLFEGGRACLKLTNENNPLDSGVEIQIQPPGKKLQKLSLLSGGETALAALALLFAIYHTCPSPFYVLDEVEATLDDLNLKRFINLLDEMKNKTQLIIITHQSRTMEIANSLYGVSMQPNGVSKLISQQFHKKSVGKDKALTL